MERCIKRVVCVLCLFTLLCSQIGMIKVNAAECRNGTAVIESDSTSWIRLGSGVYYPSVNVTSAGVAFSLIMCAIPGGQLVSLGGAVVGAGIAYAGCFVSGKVEVTQYRQAGPIDSRTKIKSVCKYYGQDKNGTYVYLDTQVKYTTLGEIYNTYEEKE